MRLLAPWSPVADAVTIAPAQSEDLRSNAARLGKPVGTISTRARWNAAATNAASNPAGISGVALAYGIGERGVARAIWNRVATRHDSDTDIVLVGVGYRF
jgi:hypothetical protein